MFDEEVTVSLYGDGIDDDYSYVTMKMEVYIARALAELLQDNNNRLLGSGRMIDAGFEEMARKIRKALGDY